MMAVMGPEQFAAELRRLFDRQLESAQRLSALFADERTALGQGHSVEIERIARDKAAAIETLQTLEREIRDRLSTLQFAEDPAEALDRALDWCDPGGDLRRRHAETMQAVIECKRDNQRNGVMVRHRLGYLRRALDVLHNAHAEAAVYGPDGRTEQTGHSRLLAEG
jgi:flagellar biosynthesis/type III secretory pathway chaperone